jgi:phage repressor protein C with HTH and peptisase S24 domain
MRDMAQILPSTLPAPSLPGRLERAMREAGYNPRSLSLAAALGATAVRDILDGRAASPRYATLAALAGVLGVSVEYLAGGEAAETAGAVAVPVSIPAAQTAGRDFPVFGSARGSNTGHGAIVMDSDPIEMIARPDPLSAVKGAYGVYIVGESMSPAYEQGDIALVHPGLPPRRGTDVILTREEPDGAQEVLVKRLVDWTDEAWTVEQYNPPDTFPKARREWRLATIVGRYNRR